MIYDGVGGDYAEPAVRALNWDGRFLVIGFPAGIPKLPLNLTLLKSCQIVGVFWGAFVARDPKGHAENLADLFRLYQARARFGRMFPTAIRWSGRPTPSRSFRNAAQKAKLSSRSEASDE